MSTTEPITDPAATVPSSDIGADDPGQRLARLIEGKAIRPATEAAIEQHKAEERDRRVAALRRAAECPERAQKFLRDRGDTWADGHEKLARTRGTILAQMRQPGGATLLLLGPQGTGKTVLAVDLIRHATADLRHARYTTAVGLLLELSDARLAGRISTETRRVAAVDVLVVDQFDKLAAADFEARVIFDLLDSRHNAEHVTVLIANGAPDTVQKMLGESLRQRIEESGGFYHCDWERFRPRG